MPLFITYILTIVLSNIMCSSLSFKILKDIADEGYKLSGKRVVDIKSEINFNMDKVSSLIPIYNILMPIFLLQNYNKCKDDFFEELRIIGAIEPMDEEEFLEYAKNPTGKNALDIFNNSKRKNNTSNSVFTFYFEDSIIKFRIENKEIVIIDITGPVSELSLKEQKELITQLIETFINGIINNYGSIENYVDEIQKDSFEIYEEEIITKNNDKEDSVDKKIEDLKKLKEEITASKEEEKDKNLTKKK